MSTTPHAPTPDSGYPPVPGPGTGQHPPVPGPPAPTPPSQKKSWFARHKILTGLFALVALVVVIQVATSGGSSDPAPGAAATVTQGATTSPEPDEEDTDEPAATDEEAAPDDEPASADAGIGTAVRDGKFEFAVTEVETGVSRIGNDMFGDDAQGQFVLVHVTVQNIGDEAQYFDASSQKLTDTEGRTHSADSGAVIYLENADSFLEQINPGNAVNAIVVFDIPADAVPSAIALRDSMFSGGVTVTLE